MLSRLKNFASRHKTKFIVSGVIVGGTIFAVRYAQRKLIEFQEAQAREFIARTKRMQHYESTEITCNQAIAGLSTNLYDEILKILNANEVLENLRTNPDNKVELWENLKVLSFTRLATFVYASSMLVVTLRIQLNLLGGYLYKHTVNEESEISNDVRQSYLSLAQYFLSDGLKNLTDMIEKKVQTILKSISLNKKLNLADVEQIFWSIQMAVNSDALDPNSKIAHYMLPKEITEKGLVEKMFNETLDILESDDVSVLCSNNVSRGFSIAIDNIAEHYSEIAKEQTNGTIKNGQDQPTTSKVHLNTVININNIELYLAKLIPIINGITSKGFTSNVQPQNLATSLVSFFLVSDKIKTLGVNVYELFSV